MDELADMVMESARASGMASMDLARRTLATNNIRVTAKEAESILQRAVARGDLKVSTKPFTGKYEIVEKAPVAVTQGEGGPGEPALMQAPGKKTKEEARAAAEKKRVDYQTRIDEGVTYNMAVAGDADTVRFVNTRDPLRQAIVSKNTYPDQDPWRITWLDDRGPSGHETFKTRDDAIRSISGERVGNEAPYGAAGDWKAVQAMTPIKQAAVQTEPKPNEVADNFPIDKIELDPDRFQYKLENREATGATGSLKGARVFDKALFGVISVWKDPADGKWYAVNGHNRTVFARDMGVRNIPVYHIDAPTAATARVHGALQNIAEGQGTVIDAAKFFRDSSYSEEDLKDKGISFTKGLQRDAMALANLAEWIFKGVINKTFPYERAVVIGGGIKDQDLQNEVIRAVEAKEKRGIKITNDVLREIVDQVNAAPVKEMAQTDLFGTTTTKKSLIFEKAAIQAHIAKELAKDKKIFGMVARNAEELARVPGQEIKAEASREISQDANKMLAVFDALKRSKGPISDIITKGAERLSEGEDAKKVKTEVYNQIREALPGAISTREEPGSGGTPSLFGGPSDQRLSVERREAGPRTKETGVKPVEGQATPDQLKEIVNHILKILPAKSGVDFKPQLDFDVNDPKNQAALKYWFGPAPTGANPEEFYRMELQGRSVGGRQKLYRLRSGSVISMIEVATQGKTPGAVGRTAYHEAFHTVWEIFLSNEERAMLADKFPSAGGMDTTEIQSNAFADWAMKKRNALPLSVKGIFNRIRNFFESLRNYLTGLGFDNAESIFGRAYKGSLAGQVSMQELDKRLSRVAPLPGDRAQIGPLYHGTALEFPQFSSEAINRGAGSQAFGWGLYFTDQENIARWYAENQGNAKFQEAVGNIGEQATSPAGRRAIVQGWIDRLLAGQARTEYEYHPAGMNDPSIVKFKSTWGAEKEAEYDRIFAKMGTDPWKVTREERETLDRLGAIRPNPNGYKFYTGSEFEYGMRDLNRYIYEQGPFPVWLMNQPYNFSKEDVPKAFEGVPEKPTRIVKKVTLHQGKTPEQYDYLTWDDTVTNRQREKVADALVKRQGMQAEFDVWKKLMVDLRGGRVPEGWKFEKNPNNHLGRQYEIYDESGQMAGSGVTLKDSLLDSVKYGNLMIRRIDVKDYDLGGLLATLMDPDVLPGGQYLYDALETRFGKEADTDHPGVQRKIGSKEASLFLLRNAGIDGIKYPSGTIHGKDEGGFNYVVFDDQAINPEGETRFAVQMSDFESDDPAVEKEMREAKGFDTQPKFDKLSQTYLKLKQSFTEHFPRLADNSKFGMTKDILRRAESVPEKAIAWAQARLEEILKPLDKAEYWGFSKMVILPDIIRDAESGLMDLATEKPFGYTDLSQVQRDYAKVTANASPRMMDAFDRRQNIMKQLVDRSVDLKLLNESAKEDDRYYHHQVMQYMNLKYYGPRVSSEDLRTHQKGYMIARKGSGLAYNTEYLQAEFEVLAQMQSQIMTKESLNEIEKNDDVSGQVKAEALRQGYSDWRDALKHFPEYRLWQPKKGNVFFNTFSLTDKVVDRVLNQGQPLTWDDLRVVLAVGQKRTQWVIPDELAQTLDNFRDFKPEGIILRGADAIQTSWKQWILFNPLRVMKYWINNLSGDLDIVIAYNHRIIFDRYMKPSQYLTSSIKDLWSDFRGRATPVQKAMLEDAMKSDVIGSGMTIKEIPDINEAGIFKALVGANPGVVQRYWGGVKEFNNFRENILRLASYRYFQDQIASGKTPYGASRREEIDAITDSTLKAAKLARELVGDYGNISESGQWLRKHMIPFYSWIEINAPRYVRLLKNIKHEGGGAAGLRIGAAATARAGVGLGIRATMLYTLVNLWNGVFFPDEDDEMQRAQRNQLHLILGRRDDGSVISIRFQGALSDALNWFGMEDFPQDFKDVVSGKVPWSKKFDEALKAPMQKLFSGARPIEKGAVEALTGKTLYPEMFKPRAIRDPWEHLAKSISMDVPYRYAHYAAGKAGILPAAKPIRGLLTPLLNTIAYTSEPGESAYYSTIEKISNFLKTEGYEVPDVSPTRRSNALYYYKQAKRFDDEATAKQWLDEYTRLGGKREDIRNSMKKSHPVAFIPIKLRRKYMGSIDAEDRRTMDIAVDWWEKTFKK